MSLPVNIDEYAKLIVQDDTQLKEQNISPAVLGRLHRLRGLYAYWLQFPSKFDKDIVQYDIAMFGVKKAQAYDDLRLTQLLLGNIQATSKDFMRWKINQDLEEDLRLARRQGDMRSVAAIEKNRILNNRTDKDDDIELEFDKIIPQVFEPTNDPAVLGITTWKGKLPQLQERVALLKARYSKDTIEDAQYEEMEVGDDE